MDDRRRGHLTMYAGGQPFAPLAGRPHGGGGSTGADRHEVHDAAHELVDTIMETGMMLPPESTPIGAALVRLCDAVETELARVVCPMDRLGLDGG